MSKRILFWSSLIAAVSFSACGTEPVALESAGYALKTDGAQDDTKAKPKDPASHVKVSKNLHEGFESPSGIEEVTASYHWVSGGSGYAKVVHSDASEGENSLEVGISEDTSASDFMGLKFCVERGAVNQIAVEFSVKFKNFVNWTGFGITEAARLQYWWWVRSDGTFFDETTLGSFGVDSWHRVRIEVLRDMNLAILTVDGNESFSELDLTWAFTDPASPMKCFFLFAGTTGASQSLLIDDIKVQTKD